MTAVPDLMVTLANGTQVPWSEFKTWSARKQTLNLIERKYSEEHRAKLSAARKGKPMTEKAREKSSLALKGKAVSEEHRAKLSAALKGRAQSAEHTAKVVQAKKNKKAAIRAAEQAKSLPKDTK